MCLSQVRRGDGVALIGGDTAIADETKDILDTLFARRFHVGQVGDGGRAKLAVNLVLGLNRLALAEGLVFAECFKTSPEAINATLGKHADVLFDTVSALIGHVQSGQLKALAVTGKERFPAVPDVPPAIESGVLPGYDVTTWYGVFAPQGTPAPVIARLSQALNESLGDESVRTRLVTAGVVVKSSTPQAFGDFMAGEHKRWDAVREAAGIDKQ